MRASKHEDCSRCKRSGGIIISAGLWVVLLFSWGCERKNLRDDFATAYEFADILLPGATHHFTITGPRGMSVDIALDYDELEEAGDSVQLMVKGSDARTYVGEKVPGSGLPLAICGVSLEPRAGTRVKVRNLKLVRSVPFALRIERDPSHICNPHVTAPSLLLVEAEGSVFPPDN